LEGSSFNSNASRVLRDQSTSTSQQQLGGLEMASIKPKPELVRCERCEGTGDIPMSELGGDPGSSWQRTKTALSRVPMDCPECASRGWKIKGEPKAAIFDPSTIDEIVDAGGY
jgi:Zn finger protein HypA/HybF involved in hydrogenase expression